MAKAKKTADLTLEERLEQALVPDAEQPYSVPENWCWTRLGNIARWGSGGTPSRKNMEYYNGTIPWVKTGELCDDFIYITEEKISEYAVANSSAKLFPVNSIVVAMYGATIGKVGILGIEATTNQACACAICANAVKYKYLFYYARSQKDAFIQKGKGGAQPNISQEIIKMHEVPIPPIKEQQRIVDRIESLFAKLDEAKEKAQAALDSFEIRKAAILHKAFTGELTAKWRKENGVGMDSWMDFQLGEIFDIVSGIQKTPARVPKNYPVPYLAVANVLRDYIDVTEVKMFEVTNDELCRLKLKKKDILVVEGNGSGNEIGRCAMWNNELPLCVHQNHIIRLRPTNANISSEYVLYYLNSNKGRDIMRDRAKTTAGLYNLSTGKIKTIPLPLASYIEQVEIVRILDIFFAKEQKAKELCSVLDNIDLIKKSILARAFRGALGTNDPAEESAVELLKTIC